MGQNVFALEYGNCRDPCANGDAVFSKVNKKSISRKKNPVLPVEKFPFLVVVRHTMLQHLTIHFSLSYLSSGRLREVKNNRKFQPFSSKSYCGRLRELIAYKRF